MGKFLTRKRDHIMQHQRRRYGWRPQLPDRRDERCEHSKDDGLPRTLCLSKENPELWPAVYNQGHLGSCTANALAAAFEYNERKAGYRSEDEFMPSRLFIYYNERALEGTIDSDSGAALRDGIKAINREGVCDERDWPYDEKAFRDKPSAACYASARKERALSYRRVDQSLHAMKHALCREKQPVVFGFTVYESFESSAVAQSGIMPIPQKGEKVLGGHAVLCVGYDDDLQVFHIRNSWGAEWGDEGYFTMPYDFLLDKDSASDFWIVTTISKAPFTADHRGCTQASPNHSASPSPSAVTPGEVPGTHNDEAHASNLSSSCDEFLARHDEALEAQAICEGTLPECTMCTREPAGDGEAASLRFTDSWAACGEGRYPAGHDVRITWATTGCVPRVKIVFGCNSWSGMFSSWSTVVQSAATHGSSSWQLPEDLPADSRYWLRLSSVDSASVSADSGYFTIFQVDDANTFNALASS